MTSKRTDPQGRTPGQRKTTAQKQAAAQRALAAGRRPQRRQWLLVFGSVAAVVAVVAVVAVLIVIKVTSGSTKSASGAPSRTASQQVTAAVSNVPLAVLGSVGAGAIKVPPTPLTGEPLTANGEPRVLYVGAEWCPYCAAERWSLAVALSRFGTLSGLGETASSPTDVYPNTATLSFSGAAYTSQYLSLTAKEIQSKRW